MERAVQRAVKPITQMLVVLLVAAGLNLATIAALHDARKERDALHVDLVHSILQRRALEKARADEWVRVRADRDLLRACRDQLTLRDAQHDSDLVRLAIQGAQYYGTTVADYVAATEEQ